MATASANGIDIEYETFGSPDDPAMLLIMGLGGQLIVWDDELCRRLAAHGLHVIRFDNRDVGLSTKFDDAPLPDMMAVLQGDRSSVAYTLDDMAADAVGLLDALGIAKAHVVGVSMGGSAGSPPLTFWARSMRTTSAPMSASIMAANGPGPMPAISMTRTPASGPLISVRPARRCPRSPRRRSATTPVGARGPFPRS